MIEFEYLTTPSSSAARAPIAINTDSIAHFEPLIGSEGRCQLVLKDGRQLLVAMSYADLRHLVIESRSGFATVLGTQWH